MDRQVLLRKIMGAGDEVRRLQQDLIALQSIDIVNYPENYSGLCHQTAIRSEYITHKLRGLVYGTTNTTMADYLAGAADSIGICVTEDDYGVVEITIPCLIPHRRKKSTGFIADPLYVVLDRFVSEKSSHEKSTIHSENTEPAGKSSMKSSIMPSDVLFKRFKHCVICIMHVYDKELYDKGRKRDHDNIEIKGIIDVINTFLLTDDTGNLCDIYNTSEFSDKDFTRISIMKKDVFPEWILRHRNQPKTPSQIS